MKFVVKLVLIALFILGLSESELIPGISVESFAYALIASLIFGVVNVSIKPILIFFTLPLTFLTLGLFVFVINALLFWLVGFLSPQFIVEGFWAAFLGALLLSVFRWLIDRVL